MQPQTSGTPQPFAHLDGPLSVLILDDERFDRHRMARLCSGLPVACTVHNAPTLAAFNSRLEEHLFHLILVDYALPDGTGLQALDDVRRSARNFNSATIMITGQSDSTVAEAALRAGCTDFLTKDELTTHKFHRAVSSALDRAALTLKVETQNFAREDVEKMLEACATQFAGDMKPMVSRSLRLMRDLRRDATKDRMDALEQSCLEMWESLIAQERSAGTDMLARNSAAPQDLNSAAIETRKPPSPFSRMQH